MYNPYQLIEELILEFVLGTGVNLVLSRKTEDTGLIRVYYFNWTGKDGHYYSLVAPCSFAMVYTFPKVDVSVADNYVALQNNLKVFANKTEWDDGKWTGKEIREYAAVLSNTFQVGTLTGSEFAGYTVLKTQIHFNPELGMTVWYKKEKIDCFTVWWGKMTFVSGDDELAEFVNNLGLQNCVKVEIKKNFKRLEAND